MFPKPLPAYRYTASCSSTKHPTGKPKKASSAGLRGYTSFPDFPELESESVPYSSCGMDNECMWKLTSVQSLQFCNYLYLEAIPFKTISRTQNNNFYVLLETVSCHLHFWKEAVVDGGGGRSSCMLGCTSTCCQTRIIAAVVLLHSNGWRMSWEPGY